MEKNRYFLFGRDKGTNKVRLIPLSDFDIYGKGSQEKRNENFLEAIDHMTLNHQTEEGTVGYLVNRNRLDNYNSELFIVCRNGNNINFFECIYNGSRHSYLLRKVTEQRLIEGTWDDGEKYRILDKFAYLMVKNSKFYDFIKSKYHNVYSKYVDYFNFGFTYKQASDVIFNDSCWAKDSYPLIRNIVEAITRFYSLKSDVVSSAFEYVEKHNLPREKSLGDIMLYTDKEYSEEQLSLFNNDDKAEKMSLIMDFMEKMDYKIFNFELGEVSVNTNNIECSDIHKRLLSSLNITLMRKLYLYVIYKAYSERDSLYKSEVDIIAAEIIALLESNDVIFNQFYAFCLLYLRINSYEYKKQYVKKNF